MKSKKQKLIIKTLRCETCGSKRDIPRLFSRNKTSGHIKHMHCINCNAVTAHKED